MKKRLNVIDLFCGAGGLSEGFKEAGFTSILGIDHNKSALETFSHNHKKAKTILGEIENISKNDIESQIGNQKVHVIIGGPPCQGFSMAGKRNPNDPRNKLVREFLIFLFGIL